MQSADSNYKELIGKLDGFIRKYYSNQLLRGTIYTVTLLLGFFLAVTLLESYAWFSTTVRSVLFWVYVSATAFILFRFIITPLLKLYHLGPVISHNEAARIIGQHFPAIQDKLINTLQLHQLSEGEVNQLDLIHASIQQKSAELRPVPFTSAIDLSANKKYLRYAAFPVCALIIVLFAAPSLITDSTKRLLQHNTSFSKPAPFQFNVLNKSLKVTQLEDFTVNLKMTGNEIPQEIYIRQGDNQYLLDKENTVRFNYTFRNIQEPITFSFIADGFQSDEYTLDVIPNPSVVSFQLNLDYPSYLGRKNESIKNTGDVIVPAGTKISWQIGTQNTDKVNLRFNDTSYVLTAADDNAEFTRRVMQSTHYSIRTSNRFMSAKDSMQYNIMVIPDQYPTITSETQQDSGSNQRLFFRGICRDDYGLSKLQFRYRFIKRNGQDVNEQPVGNNVKINGSTQDQYFHYWDLSTMNITPGDELEYYFEVWDNDGVHGPKSVRSQAAVYKAPSLAELAKAAEEKNTATKDDLAESLRQAQQLQKQLSDLEKDLVNKKNLGYEDRKKMSDLLKQQKELQQKVEEMRKQNEQNQRQQSEFKKQDAELAEKQQQLNKLFDELMSPEIKKKMEELERLMDQLDKQKLQEMVDKMKLDNKDVEKQLDRTLELYKQLELEKKLKETAENLDELAKKEEKLAEKSQDKNSESEDLKKQQQDLNKEFDQVKEDLKSIEEKNKELDFPKEMDATEQEQQSIEQDMKQSEQDLAENKKSKAGKSQKSAGEKMKKLAQKMKEQQQKEEEEQNEEDEQALRALLENLLRFSFDQEKLMKDIGEIDINNPRYLKLSQEQRKLKDDAKVLEDSLLALSKRVVQIQSAVNEQITDINDNVQKALDFLQDRVVPQARSNQQFVMTAVNNLALMLSESLDQMQKQMAQQKPGSGSCSKPGKGKPGPSASDVKKMQEKLSQQMQQMKEKMQNQGKNPGGKGKDGQSGMSEELARMAAQQEAIRNALQQLDKEGNKDGQGKLGDLQKLGQQMDENTSDIVNKRITEMTMKRNQEILTRLLESEKAERQREEEERRESNEAQEIHRTPPAFDEYKKLQLRETEMLKTIPPGFTTFYKNLVNSYFQNLED